MSKEWTTQIQYENALRNMNASAWDKMRINEKLETMQHIENERAMLAGREPCKVVVEELEKGLSGEFRPDKHEIALSREELENDLQEVCNTTLHEGVHATQEHMLMTLDLETATEEEIANAISLNMPLSEEASYEEYYNSAPEVNAREVAQELQEHIGYEQQMICGADQYMNGLETQNQIIQTYDTYPAIEVGSILNDIQEESIQEISYSMDEEET